MITSENWTENQAKELNEYLDYLDEEEFNTRIYGELSTDLVKKNLAELVHQVMRHGKIY